MGGGSSPTGETRVPSPRSSPRHFAVTGAASAFRIAGCARKLHGPGRGAGPRSCPPPPPRTARRGSATRPQPPDGAQAPRKREAAPGPPPQREQCGASGCSAAREPGARSPERGARTAERANEPASRRAGERADEGRRGRSRPSLKPWARRGARLQSGAAGRCGRQGCGPGAASSRLRGRGPRE